MKKMKYRNNNSYNNQVYSINYKFDSISPAGKFSGTALDLIKKYNELAKEAHSNGNYVEAEIFRQYAEHYRKIVTEINERKNNHFTPKDTDIPAPTVEVQLPQEAAPAAPNSQEVQPTKTPKEESSLVETRAKPAKKSFTVIEVSDTAQKPKRVYKPHLKKEQADKAPVVNE